MTKASRRKRPAKPERELPWSWHRSPGWRGQLERARRWHQRLLGATSLEDAEDFAYAFFQNCYYLRDWLSRADEGAADRLFRRHDALLLCRDLCNMTKHFELDQPASTENEPALAREYVGAGRGWFGKGSEFVVLSRGRKVDARDLAGECLQVIEDFVAKETPHNNEVHLMKPAQATELRRRSRGC